MEKLFLGIKGYVVCLDKVIGKKLWEIKLKLIFGVINLLFEDNYVFVYVGGYLFCVNVENGRIKWENKLDGYGYGVCIIVSEN